MCINCLLQAASQRKKLTTLATTFLTEWWTIIRLVLLSVPQLGKDSFGLGTPQGCVGWKTQTLEESSNHQVFLATENVEHQVSNNFKVKYDKNCFDCELCATQVLHLCCVYLFACFFFFRCDSQWVGQWVSGSVMFSDFLANSVSVGNFLLFLPILPYLTTWSTYLPSYLSYLPTYFEVLLGTSRYFQVLLGT